MTHKTLRWIALAAVLLVIAFSFITTCNAQVLRAVFPAVQTAAAAPAASVTLDTFIVTNRDYVNSGPDSVSITVTDHSDRYLLFAAMLHDGDPVTIDSVKDGATVMPAINNYLNGIGIAHKHFALANPSVGAHKIKLWFTANDGTARDIHLVAFSLYNVNQTSPWLEKDSASCESAGPVTISTDVNTSATGLVISTNFLASTNATGWGTGQVELFEAVVDGAFYATKRVGTGSSVTISCTSADAYWQIMYVLSISPP